MYKEIYIRNNNMDNEINTIYLCKKLYYLAYL